MTVKGAIAELQNLMNQDDIPFYYKGSIKKVIETIQMDCRENITGEWIYKGREPRIEQIYKCSVCERYNFEKSNYCPNCGADMRGEV